MSRVVSLHRRRLVALAAAGATAPRAFAQGVRAVKGDPAARAPDVAAALEAAERALARGDAPAALRGFEAASLREEAVDIELGTVRSLLHAGRYRQALDVAAHVAGAHPDEAEGGFVYAWLLALGGQGALALRVLDAAAARGAPAPALAELRRGVAAPFAALPPVLQAAPCDLRPRADAALPASARGVAAAWRLDARRLLAPLGALAEGAPAWARNGLGATRRVRAAQPLPALGLVLLELAPGEASFAAAEPWTAAPRDPFPGAPLAFVAHGAAAERGAAWPWLAAGFAGAADPARGRRRVGLDLPPGTAGAAAFDAAGRFAGLALQPPGREDRLVTAAELAAVLPPPAASPAPALAPRAALDSVYERALPWCCALVTSDASSSTQRPTEETS